MTLKKTTLIIEDIERKLSKSLSRLEKSYSKILKLPMINETTSDDDLETWDSFATRFARVSDLFLAKYLRAKVYNTDPAFQGTFLDILNYSLKEKWISDKERWFAIRELRNKQAHEYNEESLAGFYQALINEVPFIVDQLKAILT